MKKTIYCIRHGLALHNVLFWQIGTKAYTEYRDTRLLEDGVDQAINLGETWKDIKEIELVLVSPLSRTLSTAYHIFKKKNVKILALDFLTEYPMGIELANKRKNINYLKKLFPKIDFSLIKNNEINWNYKKETIEELNVRISDLKEWISKRNEKKIAIISHSSFIGQLKDKKIGDENNQLKHCFPYKIIL
jgi:broad specificity phosphatase PhoE